MRKDGNYQENQTLEIYCNVCGKKIISKQDMILEGVFHGEVQWGYFSKKDGERHNFDVCEECYDKWIAGFKIPVEKKIESELL